MSRFYEPWVPKVGQRVRYRASAECPGSRYGGTPDGVIGVVTGMVAAERLEAAGIESPSHRFEVTFAGGRDRCCALELEPAAPQPEAVTP